MADPVSPHLWFLPLILSLYALVPVLRIYVVNASLTNQLYFIGLWLFATTIRPLIEPLWGIPSGFYLEPVSGFIGYFVLGATLSRYASPTLPTVWSLLAGLAFIAGYGATVIGTYVNTAHGNGTLDEALYSYISPNVILMSVAAFVLMRHVGNRLQEARARFPATIRFLTLTSEASFGTYLIHMIPLDVLSSDVLGFSYGPMASPTWATVPILSTVTFAASLVLSILLRMTRHLRWLVP
jgi:surface polysaccharide O-acyltransferase-like enzyme